MTFWVAGAAVVGGIGGALIGGNAVQSAADTQAQSGRDATEAQLGMFKTQVALQEPWRQAGGLGLNSLLYGLGVSPTGTFTPGSTPLLTQGADGVFTAPDRTGGPTIPENQFNAQAYLAANPDVAAAVSQGLATPYGHYLRFGQHEDRALGPARQAPAATPTAPTPELLPAQPGQPAGSGYGSLMRDFTMADYQADPGYAFRLEQGEKSATRAAAAQGGFGSGKYLKDLTTYGQGLASQEFGNANARFNANRGFKLNALQSLAGVGQSATNQQGAAAGQFGQQVGSNIIGAGNATAAGQIGTANAYTGAIGQGISMYQQNEMLKRFPTMGTGYNPGVGTVGDFPISYYG